MELQSKGASSDNLEPFFARLGNAIANFESGRKVADKARPARVRKQLKSACNAALALDHQISQLGGNAYYLLSQTEVGSVTELNNHMRQILAALSEASHLADDYPKAGGLPDPHRVWLAIDVAKAMREVLGIEPTSTKEGLFESILSLVLETATGREAKSVNDIARNALKAETGSQP